MRSPGVRGVDANAFTPCLTLRQSPLLKNISWKRRKDLLPRNVTWTCNLLCKRHKTQIKVTASVKEHIKERSSRCIAENTLIFLEWPKVCEVVSSFAGTPSGKEQLKKQLRSLPRSLDESNYLLSETSAGIQLLQLVHNNLDFSSLDANEVDSCIKQLRKGAALEGIGALAVASLLQFCARLQSTLKLLVKENAEWHDRLMPLSAMIGNMVIPKGIVREILHTVDEAGFVKDGAIPGLKKARAHVCNVEQKLHKLLGTLMSDHRDGNNYQEIGYTNGRWCIKTITDEVQEFQGLLLRNDSTFEKYLEPVRAVPLNDELMKAKATVLRAEREALTTLTKKAMPLLDNIGHLFTSIVSLDVIIARAKYSLELEGTYPILHFVETNQHSASLDSTMEDHQKARNLLKHYQDKWLLYLRKLYHPLQKLQDRVPVPTKDCPVPIDVLVRRKTRVVVITGPNTGGKTATMKSIGLAVLMAKSGLYVLAEEPAQIPYFDSVLADIGDEQSLSQSLSTFSGHLLHIQGIQAEATNLSLVLLDEVGAGTNPLEGAALGLSLLESFSGCGSLLTIATTHLGELKALKYNNNKCENACVEFDEETLSPTYRLLWGIPGQSNALAIAQRLGLPDSIVTNAQQLYGKASVEINKVIMDLENFKRQLQDDVQEIEKYLMISKDLYQQLLIVNSQLVEYANVHERTKADKILEIAAKARSSLHSLWREYQERKHREKKAYSMVSSASSIVKDKGSDKEIVQNSLEDSMSLGAEKPNKVPSVGQDVYIPLLGKKAKVLKVKPKKNEITVQSGDLKLNIKLDQLK
eukprot:TRINITY_DN18553_c0_g1_i1.p1 TRINITY_DN18553_c0_g1~~TRINITY_DN18553_c0_g1_i1.p1  ORF type:complete len:808 (-),score=155.49 TRINITY_DN18553_c0_g1_i1:23-2446(-)